MKFLILVIFLYGYSTWITIAIQTTMEEENCEDLPPNDFVLDITFDSGELIENVKNCTRVEEKYAALCEEKKVRKWCCATCQKLGRGCFDSSKFRFTSGKNQFTCAEVIAMDPCICKERFDMPDGKKLVVKDTCCMSCKPINIEELDCSCKDRISPATPYEHPLNENEVFNSCSDLAAEFPELCRKLGSHKCCRTCLGRSPCHDTKIRTWLLPGSTADTDRIRCPELIAADKCYCTFFREDCCISCADVEDKDLKKCCVDDPKFRTSVEIPGHGEGKDRIKTKKCSRCTCQEITDEDSSGELMRKLCDQSDGKARKRCCSSCAKFQSKEPSVKKSEKKGTNG